MPYAPSGDLSIYYEEAGLVEDPALVLIGGLGSQILFWDPEFILGLVDRAFRVVTLDNRDCGLSSRVADVAAPDAGPAYRLSDLAYDVVAVLDALGIERAHVLGASLGGLVAQALAIDHRDRVRSLTLLSTTTNNDAYGAPTEECALAVVEPTPAGRAEAIAHGVHHRSLWATPAYFDAEATAAYFARCFDRAPDTGGSARQMEAMRVEPDRESELSRLTVPTLVLHGDADPLIGVDGGEHLAAVIPDARLVLLEGMAHDLPPSYWAPVIEAVTRLAISAR
jgi:pimeloyl-ACP methyl ester carboxylesterase